MLLVALLLTGCAPTACEAMDAGPARDRCLHLRVVEHPDLPAAEVARAAASMEDPIMRVATVMSWARNHRGVVADADRLQLCGLLLGQERNTCERRLSAAHLAR